VAIILIVYVLTVALATAVTRLIVSSRHDSRATATAVTVTVTVTGRARGLASLAIATAAGHSGAKGKVGFGKPVPKARHSASAAR
jgi:hypothetical protein